MTDYQNDIRAYFGRLKDTVDKIDAASLSKLMNILEDARRDGRQVFIMGNGGSASTASHYAGDFNKGLSLGKDKRHKFICLNDNIPTLMSIANDICYQDIFVEPLKNFFHQGDVVIGISGSGNSENVLRAIRWANENGGITVGLTGYDGGELKRISKHGVHIPINDMQIVEDLHLVLDHCMMKILY